MGLRFNLTDLLISSSHKETLLQCVGGSCQTSPTLEIINTTLCPRALCVCCGGGEGGVIDVHRLNICRSWHDLFTVWRLCSGHRLPFMYLSLALAKIHV